MRSGRPVRPPRAAERVLRVVVPRVGDAGLERSLGSPRGLRILFGSMASRFDPAAAGGFAGDLRFELRGRNGVVRTWTVSCGEDGARAREGALPDPEVTIKLGRADLVRLAAGELDPGRALLDGRLDLEGDFSVASRLGEMFGIPGPKPRN